MSAGNGVRGGRRDRLPRVTEVLEAVMPWRGPRPANSYALGLGTAVHEAAAGRGEAPIGYDRAIARFLASCETLAVELQVESWRFGFRGTLDRIVVIEGRTWLVDLKTGQYYNRALYQVNFYDLAAAEMGFRADRLGVILLGADESVKRVEVPREWSRVLWAMERYREITAAEAAKGAIT